MPGNRTMPFLFLGRVRHLRHESERRIKGYLGARAADAD